MQRVFVHQVNILDEVLMRNVCVKYLVRFNINKAYTERTRDFAERSKILLDIEKIILIIILIIILVMSRRNNSYNKNIKIIILLES